MNSFFRMAQCFCLFLGCMLLLEGCTSTAPTTTGIAQSTDKTPLNEKFRGDYAKALEEIETKKFTQASTALIRIMAENPGFTEGWANLALAQLRSGDIAAAKQSANNAFQLEQQSAPLQNLLGLISVEDGAYKAAEKYYLRALELKPDFANVHYNLALLNDIYYQNIAKAIQHYERYLALIKNTDPDTEAWVSELKRNLE